MLRAGIAVQRPRRQPLSCQGVRPPAVLTCLVIRDCHSRRHSRRGSMDHPVSLSTPTHRGLTTDRSTSSSSGAIDIVHVSEKSVPPADVMSWVDGPAEVVDPAEIADLANMADPPQAAYPAWMASSAGEYVLPVTGPVYSWATQ